MKKFFLLVFILTSPILFNSCDSDDDNIDPLIGQWQMFKTIENGITVPIEPDDCDFKGIIEFKAGGVYTAEDYEEILSGDCFLEVTVEGTWVNNGNNIYKIIVEGESEPMEVTFEGDTFFTTEQDGNITYQDFFKRK